MGAATATLAITSLETEGDPFGTLTFVFDNPNHWNPDLIGYHWTEGCGNDVVEAGGTPVPEPATLLLLGLGVLGLSIHSQRSARS